MNQRTAKLIRKWTLRAKPPNAPVTRAILNEGKRQWHMTPWNERADLRRFIENSLAQHG